MTADVHLEGMGWLGSALAHRLAATGVTFTWHDTDDPVCAWKACTGAVYPDSNPEGAAGLDGWDAWWNNPWWPAGAVTPTAWWWAHKRPPFGDRSGVAHDLGWLRLSNRPGYSVDVPPIVDWTRTLFADRRTPDRNPNARLHVRAHGFHSNYRPVWGWTAPVRLALPHDLELASNGRTPAFYGKPHRFQICYAYPIPTRPGWWWAGSTLQHQRTPSDRDSGPDLARWLDAFQHLFPGLTVDTIDEPLHGWRPRPTGTDTTTPTWTPDGTLQAPSLWHSGVRWAPQTINHLHTAITTALTGALR